jgi:predicted nuclease of predicted toxin-antitoxin system
MNLLIDLNLSPALCAALAKEGWNAVHWSSVGDARASDRSIMAWAKDRGYTVITGDLDFGAILAATQAAGPSVIQARMQDVRPAKLAPILISVLRKYETEIASGAIISIDEVRDRIRFLPFG